MLLNWSNYLLQDAPYVPESPVDPVEENLPEEVHYYR